MPRPVAAVSLTLAALLLGFSAAGGAGADANAKPTGPDAERSAVQKRIEKARSLMMSGEDEGKRGRKLMKEAAGELKAILKRRPEDANSHYFLGLTHFYLNRDAGALACYDTCLRLDPKHAKCHFMKGVLLRCMKQDEKALASLTKARDLTPEQAKCWFEMGQVHRERDEWEKALPLYRKTLALDPGHGAAAFYIGVYHADKGQGMQALEMFLKAVKADPSDVLAHYNAGQTYQLMGKAKLATEHFRRVVELDPNDWRARAKLVQLYQALGETAKRNADRDAIYELRKKGTVKSLREADLFCRDQFTVGHRKIMALEYFELKGDWAVRYSFNVLKKNSSDTDYRISLGSYPATNELFRPHGKLKEGQRAYHLDGYWPNEHRTYAFFIGEPTYESIKRMVIEIVTGKREHISSTVCQPDGDTEIQIPFE